MRKDGINNGSKCSFVLVVNRKLHEIILEVVILQPNELERGELLLDVLKQIWDEIYVEGSLCTETGLGGWEETWLELLQVAGKSHSIIYLAFQREIRSHMHSLKK